MHGIPAVVRIVAEILFDLFDDFRVVHGLHARAQRLF
jgi:hypothetical protein